jgi:Ser/Thr protein kinase RdoA (MazF antagonist)
MTREEQANVSVYFGLGEPQACESLGGTRNRNYLLKTTRGKFVVRDRFAGYRDPARIAFDHAALAFLYARKVPVAPPIRGLSGDTFWLREDRLWEVFPAVAGRHFRNAATDDIRALSDALSAFHLAGREFEPQTAAQKLGPRGETDPAELLGIIHKLRPDAPGAVELYEQWTSAAAHNLSDAVFASLPHTLIHGDIQPANILIDEGRVTALVDLDWCDWRPRIYDLSFAILLCCATHESPIDGSDIWSLSQPPVVQRELARVFLEVYGNQGWPMSPPERSALRAQITLSWCHCRLAGAMKVPPERRHDFLDRSPYDLAALSRMASPEWMGVA